MGVPVVPNYDLIDVTAFVAPAALVKPSPVGSAPCCEAGGGSGLGALWPWPWPGLVSLFVSSTPGSIGSIAFHWCLGKKKNTETDTFIEKLHMIFKTPMNKSGQKWKVKEKTNIDNIDKKNKHQNSQTLQLQQWNSLWRKFCAL
jgi:hypothetical protein